MEVKAQSNNANYIQMRNDGIELMRKYEYSAAFRMFDGASGFANSSNEIRELAGLQKQLNDSIRSTYNRGINLIDKSNKTSAYLVGIQELNKLVPPDNLYVPQLFSWLGFAYEQLNKPYDAMEQYAQGVDHEELYSAWRLAELLQKYKSVSVDSLVGLYEYASPRYKESFDRLGDLFFSTSPNTAYSYYKESQSNYGKYKMATLLLTRNVTSDDNPVRILENLSNDNYADAQFYLGLLYFHGEHVTQNTNKGLKLIQLAETNGNKAAKQWLIDRNKELNEL